MCTRQPELPRQPGAADENQPALFFACYISACFGQTPLNGFPLWVPAQRAYIIAETIKAIMSGALADPNWRHRSIKPVQNPVKKPIGRWGN